MKFGRVIPAVVLFFLLALRGMADPSNFMVGGITFARPVAWTWEDLGSNSKAAAQLRLEAKKPHRAAQILISFSSVSPEEVSSKWKSYFVVPPTVEFTSRLEQMKGHRVTWVKVHGTYRVKGVLKPGHTLIGAIIETTSGNVFGRLIAPDEMIAETAATFKKMIEDGLREE